MMLSDFRCQGRAFASFDSSIQQGIAILSSGNLIWPLNTADRCLIYLLSMVIFHSDLTMLVFQPKQIQTRSVAPGPIPAHAFLGNTVIQFYHIYPKRSSTISGILQKSTSHLYIFCRSLLMNVFCVFFHPLLLGSRLNALPSARTRKARSQWRRSRKPWMGLPLGLRPWVLGVPKGKKVVTLLKE